MRFWRVAALFVVASCGHGGNGTPPGKKDAGAARADAQVVLDARPLGLTDLAGYAYRKRAGQPAFQTARKAEDREDWPGVVAACKEALAADPTHLEAAWLYAVGLAKTNASPDQIALPLDVAVAGDFGKWATPSLEQPALQAFLGTPVGQAWRLRVEAARPQYVAALAKSLVIEAQGDLFAFDGSRWYRLTRTYGTVVGAFAVPAAHRIGYITRSKTKRGTTLGVGLVDVGTGHASKPAELGTPAPLRLAWSKGNPAGFWIGLGNGGKVWRQLDDDGKLHVLPPKSAQPAGPYLDVIKSPHLHRLPVPNVTADWDDQSLASAMKLGTSNRVVAAPAPGLIDGNTVVWSPDRARVAFVAQLDDHCTPGAISAAAFVAEAASGTAKELERAAAGLAVEWLADGRLAIAGDKGVTITDLTGAAAPIEIDDGAGLVAPRRKPRCTPEAETEAPDEDTSDEPAPDAGVP